MMLLWCTPCTPIAWAQTPRRTWWRRCSAGAPQRNGHIRVLLHPGTDWIRYKDPKDVNFPSGAFGRSLLNHSIGNFPEAVRWCYTSLHQQGNPTMNITPQCSIGAQRSFGYNVADWNKAWMRKTTMPWRNSVELSEILISESIERHTTPDQTMFHMNETRGWYE